MKYGTYIGLISTLSYAGLDENRNLQIAISNNLPKAGDKLELSILYVAVRNSTPDDVINFAYKMREAAEFVRTINDMEIIIEDGGKMQDEKFMTAYEVGGYRELAELIDKVNFYGDSYLSTYSVYVA